MNANTKNPSLTPATPAALDAATADGYGTGLGWGWTASYRPGGPWSDRSIAMDAVRDAWLRAFDAGRAARTAA